MGYVVKSEIPRRTSGKPGTETDPTRAGIVFLDPRQIFDFQVDGVVDQERKREFLEMTADFAFKWFKAVCERFRSTEINLEQIQGRDGLQILREVLAFEIEGLDRKRFSQEDMGNFFERACKFFLESVFKNEAELKNWQVHVKLIWFFNKYLPHTNIEKSEVLLYINMLLLLLEDNNVLPLSDLNLPTKIIARFVGGLWSEIKAISDDREVLGLLESSGLFESAKGFPKEIGEFRVRLRVKEWKFQPGSVPDPKSITLPKRESLLERMEKLQLEIQEKLKKEERDRQQKEEFLRRKENRHSFAKFVFGDFQLHEETVHRYNIFGHKMATDENGFVKEGAVAFNIFEKGFDKNSKDEKQVREVLRMLVTEYLSVNSTFPFDRVFLVNGLYDLLVNRQVNGQPFNMSSFYDFLKDPRQTLVDKLNLMLFTFIHANMRGDKKYSQEYAKYKMDSSQAVQRVLVNTSEFFSKGLSFYTIITTILEDYLGKNDEAIGKQEDLFANVVLFDPEISILQTTKGFFGWNSHLYLPLRMYSPVEQANKLVTKFTNMYKMILSIKYFGQSFREMLSGDAMGEEKENLLAQFIYNTLTLFRQNLFVDVRELR